MKKIKLKQGVCITVRKRNMIHAAVKHDESDQIKILKIINKMILNYNESKIYNIEDDILRSIRFLENKNRFTLPFDEEQAGLTSYALTLANKIFSDESFELYSDCGGKIAISGDEVSKLQSESKHKVTIDLDKNAITFSSFSFIGTSDDEFLETYPGSDISKLDEFEYDFYYLKFNHLQEAIKFYDEHNTKENLYKRFFKVNEKDGLIYQLA